MTLPVFVRAWLVLVAGATLTEPARAEFNPQGRHKKPSPAATPPRSSPAAQPGPSKPVAKPSPAGPRADPAPARKPDGPGVEALIQRYSAIVLAQPGADFPLERLIELYRERDGKIDALTTELAQKAQTRDASRYSALVALAGIYKLSAEPERAQHTYELAIGEDPKNPIALRALAHMLAEHGDKAGARSRFEQALPQIRDNADREQVLRTLLALCLDLKDYDAAKRFHSELVKRSNGSFFVRAELGRELFARGDFERAAVEYKGVLRDATGDNRVLAPALRDYAKALAKLGKQAEAEKELRRALDIAGEAGVRREIYEAIVEIHRNGERLPELVRELEKRGSTSADELRILAALYEETGQVDKALGAYRRALGRDPKDIATRLKVVHLLEVRGDLDQAIAEYDALIRAAPRNPDFVFQLADALISRGDRKQALVRLKELEARSQADEETQAALVDFYERVEEKDRALALLQRLAEGGSTDPQHLVELGSRYWQEGDKKRAVATWQRIKLVLPDRSRALLMLGELYLEHDMPNEALAALAEASKREPKQGRFRKAYALALERTGAAASTREIKAAQFEEARKIWELLLRDTSTDPTLQREARQHLVTLWSLEGQLAQRVPTLEHRLADVRPDLDAGRLLAEAHLRLRRYADAERVLGRVIANAPGDIESMTLLERVLVLEHKLGDAIAVLEKLALADTKRAREYYQRMASYAAELYQDERAVRYAARAVELSPEDAEGHKKLGEMYRTHQDIEKSMHEFRQAISKNERLFPVYLELAELLLGQAELEQADLLLRRVVRASPDDELVAQAARLSMQVNLGRGTLESLERDLLPLALGSPGRPIYRHLLIEIYGALAYPLLERVKSPNAEEADLARAELDKLGERAIKPLLDALGDAEGREQQLAITLLGHVGNKSAGPPLLAYATGPADTELRTRAMIAVGALADPGLLPRYTSLLAPNGRAVDDESDKTILAAAWGVARMRSLKAARLLTLLANSGSDNIRALGVLGLALLGQRDAAPLIARIARSAELGPVPRAAAAFALGELGQKAETAVLTELVEAPDPSLHGAALVALARLAADSAPHAIAEGLLQSDPSVVEAAASAALIWATGEYKQPSQPLLIQDARVDVRALIFGLLPRGYSVGARIKTLKKLAAALGRAAAASAQASPDRARAVSDLLVADAGKLPFAALTRELIDPTPADRESVLGVATEVGSRVVQTFTALARHPSADVRLFALRFLAGRDEADAHAALAHALADRDDAVRRAALALLGPRHADALAAVVDLVEREPDWAIRSSAVQALGRVARGRADASVIRALGNVAQRDDYALVREAALLALVEVSAERAKPVLERSRDTDPEPRVKARAKALLESALTRK